ncbi:MAG: hypothetical protein ACI9XR_001398 [Flavobacterium sp.]|jgi:hypothetical protein
MDAIGAEIIVPFLAISIEKSEVFAGAFAPITTDTFPHYIC